MFSSSVLCKTAAALCCISFLAPITDVWCQQLPTIQTDRPDQTECSYLVPPKHFQFEMGFNYEVISDKELNFVYPTTLWKYGVNSYFELRCITELVTAKLGQNEVTGLNPVGLGFKAKLAESKGFWPMTSIIAHIYVPQFASEEYTTTTFASDFRFTLQHALSDKINLGYNIGAEWDGNTTATTFIYTITTSYAFTDNFGAYIELFGYVPDKAPTYHLADGGITILLAQNIQLDISGGYRVTQLAPEMYASLGFSMRLPK